MMKSRPQDGGTARRLITRALAGVMLLTMYGFGMIATTGLAMTASVTPAYAQRGRGRGGGRGRGRGWGGGGNAGAAIGLGIGAAIIGGAIAASAAEDARRRDAIGYCSQRYRSFNPATMTYIGNDGRARPCP
ncbi:BA14K family protein [Rhodopseudomonas palustris]|uniref:BA14K family protein n=1 Tax=Rhodopseudomonas palustris TaxID=1076 RepID=UPI002ACE88AE|nr:BA14K family protein [Rhodopseudomonas palustris]WQH00583.1 BA14K family protein [Rhodopseudomonas palustris]